MEGLHGWAEGEDSMDFVEIAYEMWEDSYKFCDNIETCSWETLFKEFPWPGDLTFLTFQSPYDDVDSQMEWVVLCLFTDVRKEGIKEIWDIASGRTPADAVAKSAIFLMQNS